MFPKSRKNGGKLIAGEAASQIGQLIEKVSAFRIGGGAAKHGRNPRQARWASSMTRDSWPPPGMTVDRQSSNGDSPDKLRKSA